MCVPSRVCRTCEWRSPTQPWVCQYGHPCLSLFPKPLPAASYSPTSHWTYPHSVSAPAHSYRGTGSSDHSPRSGKAPGGTSPMLTRQWAPGSLLVSVSTRWLPSPRFWGQGTSSQSRRGPLRVSVLARWLTGVWIQPRLLIVLCVHFDTEFWIHSQPFHCEELPAHSSIQ